MSPVLLQVHGRVLGAAASPACNHQQGCSLPEGHLEMGFAFALQRAGGGEALVLFENAAGGTGSPSESFQSEFGPWVFGLLQFLTAGIRYRGALNISL